MKKASEKKTSQPQPEQKKPKSQSSKIKLLETATLKDIVDLTGMTSKELLDGLKAKGFSVNLNDTLTPGLSQALSKTFQVEIDLLSIEEEMRQRALSQKEELVIRPPVVTIMGHVDHGKTTLLDAIRQSNLVGKESGGITQHIGAYQIIHNSRPITFIDTPGHEAFTQLRARGAKVTDIVVLVVSADDGVMPQTKEAINHARAAHVPILAAINKVDKSNADVEKTKQQLSKEGLLVEEWGGDVISVEVSAKEKKNLKELLEMILLLSDVMEIKSNPKVPAQGIVLEARLDPRKGPVGTVIIQHGILNQGDAYISGNTYGKVRAMFDENRKALKKAGSSMPVEILGFSHVPVSGNILQVVSDLESARKISELRLSRLTKEEAPSPEHMTLDQLFSKLEDDETKELPLIIKADVHGSVEVLEDILSHLSSDKIKINIIHSGTGTLSESDVLLASTSDAIIIGYNIKPNKKIAELAKEENVEIRTYSVIYKLTEDIKKAMTGLLEPTLKEIYMGRAEIRRIFQLPRVGAIAGCFVTDGKITRNAEIKILRNGEVIHKGRISSLKHLKDNMPEVRKAYECGIGLEKFKDIQKGDVIEAFMTEKTKPE